MKKGIYSSELGLEFKQVKWNRGRENSIDMIRVMFWVTVIVSV